MQVIGYTKAIGSTTVIDYDSEPGKQYVGRMAIEECEYNLTDKFERVNIGTI